MMRVILRGFAALAFGVVGLSFAGAYLPLGDSLAVFRPAFVALAVGLGLLAGARFWALVPLAAMGPVGLAYVPRNVAAEFTFYQKNLLYKRAERSAFLADVAAVAPDFMSFEEVSHPNRAVLAALKGQLPSQKLCTFSTVTAVAVASRFAMVPGSGTCGPGMAAMQVVTPQGPVWVVAVHLLWSWPRQQAAQVAQLVPVLERLDGPVVMGGDFNMVPWSHSLRALAGATRTRRAGPARGSYDLQDALPLPIDHVLAPGGGTTELREKLGSDHRGVVARIAL